MPPVPSGRRPNTSAGPSGRVGRFGDPPIASRPSHRKHCRSREVCAKPHALERLLLRHRPLDISRPSRECSSGSRSCTGFSGTGQLIRRAIGSLGDIPLLVLTAGDFLRYAPPGDPRAVRLHRLWLDLHRDLIQESSNAQQILVEKSGHFLQREQPQIVAAAIRQMVMTINGRMS